MPAIAEQSPDDEPRGLLVVDDEHARGILMGRQRFDGLEQPFSRQRLDAVGVRAQCQSFLPFIQRGGDDDRDAARVVVALEPGQEIPGIVPVQADVEDDHRWSDGVEGRHPSAADRACRI